MPVSDNFKYKAYKPNKAEKARRSFVQDRLIAMDTRYRRSLIEQAQLGRSATDGLATDEDRIFNAELAKIPISHAVIMQRMSTLADNPSKAIYRTENKDKNRLTIAEQLNRWDKIEGAYDASYLGIMLTAEKEGICFAKQGWHEKIRMIEDSGDEFKPVTVGKMFTSQEEVQIENMFWDPRANQLRGYKGIVANDAMDREFDSVMGLRIRFEQDENYKNIDKVKPLNASDPFYYRSVWDEKWFSDGSANVENQHGEVVRDPNIDPSMEVIIWHYYARNFYDITTGFITDKYLVYANGVEIREDEIPVPKIKGDPVLPYVKFVSLPTGGMGGLSIPALIRHPEKMLQRMVTMADAQAELAVNPIQFVSSSIADALDDSEIFPGARVEVSMNGRSVADEVYFHSAPDMTQGAQYIIDKMLMLITMITGVDISVLFESPRTKAISTERKREIQEKLLRFSVIYNETHGFSHLEELRLYLMLENWPIKRYFLDKNDNGEEVIVRRYPSIPVNGFEVKMVEGFENKSEDEQQFEVKKSSKSFNLLVINPASIEPNVHLYIEGATKSANEDTFKLNKAIEKANLLSTNPWTVQVIDPKKGARNIFEMLNADEDDWIFEQLEESGDNMHGATKEIQALLLSEVNPVQIQLDEDYDAEEYVNVFAGFMQLKEFKGLSSIVQRSIVERYQFHLMNSLNPYYKLEVQQMHAKQQQEVTQAAQGGQASSTAVKAARGAKEEEGSEPRELTKQINSKAGKLGKAGKTTNQLSGEQR